MANKYPMKKNVLLNTVSKEEITNAESRFFNELMENLSNSNNLEMTYSFEEIDYLNQYKQGVQKLYDRELIRIINKLMLFRISRFNESMEAYESFSIIVGYNIFYEKGNGYLKLFFNKEVKDSIKLIFKNEFDLEKYAKFSSSYTRRAFQLISEKIMESDGLAKQLYLDKDEFIDKFDVPTSYSQSDIDKNIINKVVDELSNLYPNFQSDKDYGDTRGKPVVGYIFRWDRK